MDECRQTISRVKVLHLISTLDLGGAESQLFRLLCSCDKDQFQCSVVSLTSLGVFGKKIEQLGIPVYALGMKRGIPSLGALMRFLRILRTEAPDIVQTWMYHADLLGAIGKKIVGGMRLVWNIRCSNLEVGFYRRLTSWLLYWLKRLSVVPDVIVTNSHAGKVVHQQSGYRATNWCVIPNGLDLELFQPSAIARAQLRAELDMKSSTLIIGLIARYDPMKDHATFLEAAGLLHSLHSDIRFVLCGVNVDWDNAGLCQSIHKHSLRDAVHLLGERSDACRITAALDIACSTSAFGEGFSNAIGEAMACAVPCVVTDVGDSAQLVGMCGRIVPPRNPNAVLQAWLDLVELGAEGRAQLGADARVRAAEKFNVKRMTLQYEALYDALLVGSEVALC